MSKLVFDLFKYKQWRMDKEHLDKETIDWIVNEHHYQLHNGIDRDELCRQGHIILEDWCVEVNESESK